MSFTDKVKLIFSRAFQNIVSFILPFIKLFLKDVGRIVLREALIVVKGIQAQKKLPSEEKQKAAFDLIKLRLKELSIEAGTSMINSAIEIAVQKIKN